MIAKLERTLSTAATEYTRILVFILVDFSVELILRNTGVTVHDIFLGVACRHFPMMMYCCP